MRERFDFASISNIILENRKTESFRNKEYFYTLFDYAFLQEDIKICITDETNISRILNSERAVPKEIGSLYQLPDNYRHLKEAVLKILEEVFDVDYVKEQVYNLMKKDITLSSTLKNKLSKNKEDALLFLTDCILESLIRVPAKPNKEGEEASNRNIFSLSDVLDGYHYPKPNRVFLGREKELDSIHEQLKTEHCLFLQGIGGIGKSELAKQYGKRHKKEYEHVIYLQYTENLHRTICELAFIDDIPGIGGHELFEMHYRFFKRLDANTLVILDNFDTLPEQEDLFQDFLSLSFRLLVTTRSIIEGVPCYQVGEIESLESLEEIFYTYAPKGKVKPNEVQDIIREVYSHTLTVEMAARFMSTADLTSKELLESLRDDGVCLSSINKVRIQKDSKTKKAAPKEHLSRLFRLQHLTGENQEILRHFLLMPHTGISKGLFRKWMEIEDFNSINNLIDYGWIRDEEETCRITIHPFLYEVLKGLLCPSFKKCSAFIEKLGQEYVVDVQEEIYFRDLINITKSIFRTIEADDTNLAFLLFTKILMYLEKYMYYQTMSDMLDIMQEIVPLGMEYKIETATYEFYQGIIAWGKGDRSTGKEYFQNALVRLKPFDENSAKLAIELYSKFSIYCLSEVDIEKCQEYAKKAVELTEQFCFAESLDYEMQKLLQYCAELAITGIEEPIDMESVFKAPQTKPFREKIKEIGESFTRDELQSDVEKIQPEELYDDVAKVLFQNVKEELDTVIAAASEVISLKDTFGSMFSVIEKIIKQ